jgi:hypothetical protein
MSTLFLQLYLVFAYQNSFEIIHKSPEYKIPPNNMLQNAQQENQNLAIRLFHFMLFFLIKDDNR